MRRRAQASGRTRPLAVVPDATASLLAQSAVFKDVVDRTLKEDHVSEGDGPVLPSSAVITVFHGELVDAEGVVISYTDPQGVSRKAYLVRDFAGTVIPVARNGAPVMMPDTYRVVSVPRRADAYAAVASRSDAERLSQAEQEAFMKEKEFASTVNASLSRSRMVARGSRVVRERDTEGHLVPRVFERLTVTDADGRTGVYEMNDHGYLKVVREPAGGAGARMREAVKAARDSAASDGTGESFFKAAAAEHLARRQFHSRPRLTDTSFSDGSGVKDAERHLRARAEAMGAAVVSDAQETAPGFRYGVRRTEDGPVLDVLGDVRRVASVSLSDGSVSVEDENLRSQVEDAARRLRFNRAYLDEMLRAEEDLRS